MSQVKVNETYLYNIGNAIRNKTGNPTTYKPSEMAQAIQSIVTTPTLQNKTVTSNGTVNADAGYDGLGTVTVNVQYSIPSANGVAF